jgi:transcriptional regulator with XRE-family HTH domain
VDTIGERLREERLRNGWSQKDLARESKINVDTISGIETGQHEPRPSTLTKLAKALSIEVRDLFEEPALSGKAEAPATGPQSLEWALTAPTEEYSEWILNAAPHELHKTWILLSEYAKDLETGEHHRFATDRAQAATAQFFRLNPPVAARPRKSQVSADEENRESREVG